MRIEKNVYYDLKHGKDADIHSITHYIQSIDDVYEIIKDLINRFNKGWSDFKVEKHSEVTGSNLTSFITVDFKYKKEWKYLKLLMDKDCKSNSNRP